MKTIEVHVSMGLVGCRREASFEVEDDAEEEEIDDLARQTLFGLIEWDWRVKK